MADDHVIIVIVSYGRPPDVARCLTAIAAQTHTRFEVVVVENAGPLAFEQLDEQLRSGDVLRLTSSDASSTVVDAANPIPDARRCHSLRLFAGGAQAVHLIEATGNLGYGGGINVALAAIAGQPGWGGVWVVNPDAEPDPHALREVLSHTQNGGYGLVGSMVAMSDTRRVQIRGGIWRRWIARGLGIGIGETMAAPADVGEIERRLDWISGAAMYATRAFIEAVGPMDHRYFLYCEDVDWSLRRGTFKLGYAHTSIVYHEHGTTIGSSHLAGARSKLSIYLTERNKLLLTRWHYPAIYPIVAALCLPGLAQSYLMRGNWPGFRTGLKGWAAGIRGETGPPPAGALS